MPIINFLKNDITIPSIICFVKSHLQNGNNNKNFRRIEKYSCWAILLINGVKIEAKIFHIGRGKFKIVEDIYRAKYVNKIVDASDVIHCNLKSDDIRYHMKYNRAQFEIKYIDLKL